MKALLYVLTAWAQLYIAGESYAGQHIPYIAEAMHKLRPSWNLRGLLLGNAWIDPVEQNLAILDYAHIYQETGIISSESQAKELEASQAVCMDKLAAGGKDRVETGECEKVLTDIFRVTRNESKPENEQCINMYDMRLHDSYPSCGEQWTPGLADLTEYFNRDNVLDALHVNKAAISAQGGWIQCTSAVGNTFRARESIPSIRLLPSLLKHVPIVLYSGADDLICNRLGTERLIANMVWNGGKGFQLSQLGEDTATSAPKEQWMFEGQEVGVYQEARNLSFVVFRDASHMVPFDQPARSREMLRRLMERNAVSNAVAETKVDGFEDAGLEVGVGGFTGEEAKAAKKKYAEQVENELKGMRPIHQSYVTAARVAFAISVVIAACFWGCYFWLKSYEKPSPYCVVSSSEVTLQGMEAGVAAKKEKTLASLQREGRKEQAGVAQDLPSMKGMLEDDGFGV